MNFFSLKVTKQWNVSKTIGGEKMNQEVYVTNQSIIKITEDVVFMNRYYSNMFRGQYSTY